LFCVTFAGQVMMQGVTVTVNEQLAIFPDASVTVQLTVVTPGVLPGPTGKQKPDGGLHTTAFIGSGQLSLAVGAG
jgi:hypothetical protein